MATTNEHASNAIVSMAAFYAAVLAEVTKANGALQDRIKVLDSEVSRMATVVSNYEREADAMNVVIAAAVAYRQSGELPDCSECNQLLDALAEYERWDGSNATG